MTNIDGFSVLSSCYSSEARCQVFMNVFADVEVQITSVSDLRSCGYI